MIELCLYLCLLNFALLVGYILYDNRDKEIKRHARDLYIKSQEEINEQSFQESSDGED